MSSRNFRKLCGAPLPPPDSDSDGDFDPLANRQKKATYAGLELSSESDPERNESKMDEESEEDASKVQGGARKKVQKKKKSKGKGKGKKSKTSLDNAGEASTSSMNPHTPRVSVDVQTLALRRMELDEIDKSIMEVNALLGAPEPVKEQPRVLSKLEQMKTILAVNARHLNVSHELRRLFGPEDAEEIRQRVKLQPHRARILKRVMIGPTNDTIIYDFKRQGLSMSVLKREGDVTYFVYDHDKDHQKMHHAFLQKYAKNFMRQDMALLSMDEARRQMHVEPLLEIADTLFRMDENSLANEIIENVVTYLQFVAHPSFNLASMNVRLLYTYVENRPFHVAMLKYLYLLTNKACHRTALEIAKMLLNIDPCDPLAILFIIDTLALRAREHQWLIEAIEYFTKQRQANMLFNIQYSFALSHFHVSRKAKRDLFAADKHLQVGIMSYPEVVVKILEFANVHEPRIQQHSLFTKEHRPVATEGLSELIMIYAKLTWPRWREPHVMEWLIKNGIEVTENYNNSEQVRNEVNELAELRQGIFRTWPTEILRHVSVVKNMSNLLLETTLNTSSRPTSGWDPLFDTGVNRYAYRAPNDPPRNLTPVSRALLYRYARENDHMFRLAYLTATLGKTVISFPWGSHFLSTSNLLPIPPAVVRPQLPEFSSDDDIYSTTSSDESTSSSETYSLMPAGRRATLRSLFTFPRRHIIVNPVVPMNGMINRPQNPDIEHINLHFRQVYQDMMLALAQRDIGPRELDELLRGSDEEFQQYGDDIDSDDYSDDVARGLGGSRGSRSN